MKKEISKSKAVLTNDLPDVFSRATFKRKHKKGLLPDVFYLRWELELMSAGIAIVVLLIVPDWLNDKVAIFLSGYATSMNSEWISIACNILVAFFTLYIIMRAYWIYYIRNNENTSTRKIHFARIIDHFAGFIFSACIVILIFVFLVSMIQFLAIFLKNSISDKMNNVTGISF